MSKYALLLAISLINVCSSCPGCVDLDELTFEKTLSKFKTALVKFDQAFPFGETHEVYTNFSQHISNITMSETTTHPDVIVATVGIKDYGDLENKKLADKYGIQVETFPVIKLFNNGDLERPVDFNIGKDKLTVSRLFLFMKQHAAAYIKAPGCAEDLDELAQEFMQEHVDRNIILQKASEAVGEIKCEKKKSIAEFYVKLMKNLIEKGSNGFIALQQERMTKLLQDKISEKKSEEIGKKLNILMSFKKYLQESNDGRQEL